MRKLKKKTKIILTLIIKFFKTNILQKILNVMRGKNDTLHAAEQK